MSDSVLPLGLVLGTVLAVWPSSAAADDPLEPIKDQKVFTIREAKFAPGRIPDGGVRGISAHTWQITDPKNPARLTHTATIDYSYIYKFQKKGQISSAAHLALPCDMGNGTIFPLLGFMYRVNMNGGDTLTLEWLPESKFPPGLKPVKPDSLFIHLDYDDGVAGTTFQIPDKGVMVRLMLRNVKREKDGAKRPVATLVYLKDEKPTRVDVREGDVLATPHVGGYEVRAIVPADPKNRVLGWVELSSVPIPDADLATEKRPVVHITTDKK